ncbi:MAG: sigma-54 interaction domain-containing protein [Chloroflexota bacterium]
MGRVVEKGAAMNDVDREFITSLQYKYGIIGRSRPIRESLELLLQAAPTDLTVLITGETGTGKEVFANAIHGLSLRKKMPFVSVNCGAIPETLLESELFGHEKGAFTGAADQRMGFFEAANKGTIFLDEIGEMPIQTQVKLLRVLENGEFSRLGSSSIKKIDVRVIAATNRNLERNVKDGTFRQDLFFRLNSVHIQLPPLRNHPEDIGLLVDYFAEAVCSKLGIRFEGISDDALSMLKSLPWRGNIRELRNLTETIVTLEKASFITSAMVRKYVPPALPPFNQDAGPDGAALVPYKRREEPPNMDAALIFRTLLEMGHDIADIKTELRELSADIVSLKEAIETLAIQTAEQAARSDAPAESDNFSENYRLETLERRAIEYVLKKFAGNRRLAAATLGISERTLYRKISEYGISE